MSKTIRYRGYTIERSSPAPIPTWKDFQWAWCHEDYDGPGDRRCGQEASIEACIDAIDEVEDE